MHLTSSIIETSAGQHGPSISVSMISLHVSTSTFLTTASFCCTAKIDGKCIKECHPLPLWEFIILNTEGGRDRERCSLGHPFNGGDFSFQALKRGRRNAGPGQECQTQNTTQHSWQADISTMPERKRSVLYCTSNCSSIMEMHI